jgi:hypothetical protein
MRIAVIGAFVLILLARPFGRWRANVWFKGMSSNKKERVRKDSSILIER